MPLPLPEREGMGLGLGGDLGLRGESLGLGEVFFLEAILLAGVVLPLLPLRPQRIHQLICWYLELCAHGQLSAQVSETVPLPHQQAVGLDVLRNKIHDGYAIHQKPCPFLAHIILSVPS